MNDALHCLAQLLFWLPLGISSQVVVLDCEPRSYCVWCMTMVYGLFSMPYMIYGLWPYNYQFIHMREHVAQDKDN